MGAVRTIVRTVLSVGRNLHAPWDNVVPALLIGVAYLLLVRVLLPYIVRIGRAVMIAIISVVAFILLLPDLASTSVRRSRGRQPAAWTFAVGDALIKTRQRWLDALRRIEPKAKKHTRLAILVIVAAAATPVVAFNGAKSTTNPRLRADSAKVLNWYSHLHRWADK